MNVKNNNGNSLVGIIIVAGLMVSILYGVMDLLNFGQKNQAGFITNMDFQQTQLTAMMILTNPKLCESNFFKKILIPANTSDAVPSFQSIFINSEKVIPDDSNKDLKAVKIKVQNPVQAGAPAPNRTLYKADITIEAESAKEGVGSPYYLDSFPIQFIVDQDMSIVSCYSAQAKACTNDPTNNTPPSGSMCETGWFGFRNAESVGTGGVWLNPGQSLMDLNDYSEALASEDVPSQQLKITHPMEGALLPLTSSLKIKKILFRVYGSTLQINSVNENFDVHIFLIKNGNIIGNISDFSNPAGEFRKPNAPHLTSTPIAYDNGLYNQTWNDGPTDFDSGFGLTLIVKPQKGKTIKLINFRVHDVQANIQFDCN